MPGTVAADGPGGGECRQEVAVQLLCRGGREAAGAGQPGQFLVDPAVAAGEVVGCEGGQQVIGDFRDERHREAGVADRPWPPTASAPRSSGALRGWPFPSRRLVRLPATARGRPQAQLASANPRGREVAMPRVAGYQALVGQVAHCPGSGPACHAANRSISLVVIVSPSAGASTASIIAV